MIGAAASPPPFRRPGKGPAAIHREVPTGGRFAPHVVHVGDVFGELRVVALAGTDGHRSKFWIVECQSCGRRMRRGTAALNEHARHGVVQSCPGCAREVWRTAKHEGFLAQWERFGGLYTDRAVLQMQRDVHEALLAEHGPIVELERARDLGEPVDLALAHAELPFDLETQPMPDSIGPTGVHVGKKTQRALYLYPLGGDDDRLWACEICGDIVERCFGCINCLGVACIGCVGRERHRCADDGVVLTEIGQGMVETSPDRHTGLPVVTSEDLSRERWRQIEHMALVKCATAIRRWRFWHVFDSKPPTSKTPANHGVPELETIEWLASGEAIEAHAYFTTPAPRVKALCGAARATNAHRPAIFTHCRACASSVRHRDGARRAKLTKATKHARISALVSKLESSRDMFRSLDAMVIFTLGELQKEEPDPQVIDAVLYALMMAHRNDGKSVVYACLRALDGSDVKAFFLPDES